MMGETTKIEWCDHSASPWYGCSEAHLGCDRCYARELSKRNPAVLGVWGDNGTRVKSKSFIKNLRAWNKAAEKAGKTETVFPSLCDPFEDRPELVAWRNEMFAVADECPWIHLLLLTKRPGNIRRMWAAKNDKRPIFPGMPGPLGEPQQCIVTGAHRPNVHLYYSASDQPSLESGIGDLLACRDLTPTLGLSLEPLVGEIDLRKAWKVVCAMQGYPTGDILGVNECPNCSDGWCPSCDGHKCRQCGGTCSIPGIDHVIIGGESGHGARTCYIDHVRSLVRQCQDAGTAVFLKQFGSNCIDNDPISRCSWPELTRFHATGTTCRVMLRDPKGGDESEWPEDLQGIRQFPKSFKGKLSET